MTDAMTDAPATYGDAVAPEPAGTDDYPSAVTDAYRAAEGELGGPLVVTVQLDSLHYDNAIRVFTATTVEIGNAGTLVISGPDGRMIYKGDAWVDCQIVEPPQPDPEPETPPEAAAVPAELYPPAGVAIQP